VRDAEKLGPVHMISSKRYTDPIRAAARREALNVGCKVDSRVFVVFISSEQRKAGRPLASRHVQHWPNSGPCKQWSSSAIAITTL
jgi:hypothetical protein